MTREDIESQGFEFTGKSIDIWFKKEGCFEIGWNAYKIILHYGLHDNRLHIYADDPGSDDFHLFRGIISSLEEFKVLLKQLNING